MKISLRVLAITNRDESRVYSELIAQYSECWLWTNCILSTFLVMIRCYNTYTSIMVNNFRYICNSDWIYLADYKRRSPLIDVRQSRFKNVRVLSLVLEINLLSNCSLLQRSFMRL